MMNTPYPSASLYVGDLHPEVTEGQLFEIFNTVGPVASIRVCRDAITRRSLGYAYVNYHNVADAERALDTLNNTPIRAKACRIMWSQRDPSVRKSGVGNVFIKNLDKSIDHRALYDTFSAFGNILSCKVVTDENNNSKGYGFVHFETQEQAEKSIARVNGMMLNGKQVYVGPFVPKKERLKHGDANKFTNVYVKNLDEALSEEKLNAAFSKFGKLRNCVIMRDESGKSKGFGFVNFENYEEARTAVDQMNGKDLGVKQVYCGRAQKKSERETELRQKFEQLKSERLAKYQGVNLYIKNLEDDWDDEKLKTEFSTFGNITSAKVMKDDKSVSRGFGFVCFSAPDEATRAVTEMNGRMCGNKPLYVALAQRKEVRRAQLEAQLAQRLKRANVAAPPMFPAGNPPVFYAQPSGLPAQLMYPQPQQMINRNRWTPAPGQYQPMPNYMVQMQRPARPNGRQLPGRRFNGRAGREQQPIPQPAPGPTPAAPQLEPLTHASLAQYPPDQQLNMIGERLFTQISKVQPELAGKITGMLLERYGSSVDELLKLQDNDAELNSKINQALEVLASYAAHEGKEGHDNKDAKIDK